MSRKTHSGEQRTVESNHRINSPVPGVGSLPLRSIADVERRIQAIDGVAWLELTPDLRPLVVIKNGDPAIVDTLETEFGVVTTTDGATPTDATQLSLRYGGGDVIPFEWDSATVRRVQRTVPIE